jgi:hypothetical protein
MRDVSISFSNARTVRTWRADGKGGSPVPERCVIVIETEDDTQHQFEFSPLQVGLFAEWAARLVATERPSQESPIK